MKYEIKVNENGKFDIYKIIGYKYLPKKVQKISGGFSSLEGANNMLNKIKGSK